MGWNIQAEGLAPKEEGGSGWNIQAKGLAPKEEDWSRWNIQPKGLAPKEEGWNIQAKGALQNSHILFFFHKAPIT
jgi:hypothetical protein